MAEVGVSAEAVTTAEIRARKALHVQIGARLDHANARVLSALADGDRREHAGSLIERAWVEMLMRDLHGRTTALGRIWEQHMIRDVELAAQVATPAKPAARVRGGRRRAAAR